jgi:non-ribosomal peptide synthetase component E (peptide arylation enzyme)
MQAVHNVGPIPQGEYDFGTPHDSNEMGPYVTALIPNDHNAFGRSGFYLHGDNSYHDASHGCIVISPRSSREEIVRDGGPIVVVATDDDVEGTLQSIAPA